MPFPEDWNRVVAYTIDPTKVVADETDLHVLIMSVPDEVLDADGDNPALSDGGDIRFTTDREGTTEISVEIQEFVIDNDPANGSAVIWIKVPFVSSTVDTIVYMWYNNPGATLPARDATFGSENVWDSGFQLVFHMQDMTNDVSDSVVDSTSNENHGIPSSCTLVDGNIGNAIESNGLNLGSVIILDNGGAVTNSAIWSFWIKKKDDEQGGNFARCWSQRDDFEIAGGGTDGNVQVYNGAWADTDINIGPGPSYVYHKIDIRRTASNNFKAYKNGVFISDNNPLGSSITENRIHLFRRITGSAEGLACFLSEVRLSNATNRTEAYITTTYNNESDPASFISFSNSTSATIIENLTTFVLNNITDVSFTNSDNEISQASFSIPIVETSNTLGGYKYNKSLDRYEDINDAFNKYLRKNDLIEIEIGYKEDDDSDQFIKKFVGNIKSFQIQRQNKNSDIIKVECNGFGSFLKDSLNFNYPNEWDYWVSEFAGLTFSDSRPDGISFPTTYDGWPLDKVIKSLFIRGNIDPHLFNTNQLFLNNAEVQISGSNLIEQSNPQIVLERARNYGGPNKVFFFETVDDEYRLQSNFGDTIFDYINKVTEPYGWEWGFHPFYDGAPYLRARNNPTTIISSEFVDTLSGTWSGKLVNLDVISGTYQETFTADSYVEHVFTGQRIDLVSVLASNRGGAQAIVVSGSNTETIVLDPGENETVISLMSEVGDSLSAGNRIIIDFSEGSVNRIINSISSSSILVNRLNTIPVSGTTIRSAVVEVEIRRGNNWATATQIVTGTYIPAYYGHELEKILPVQRVSIGLGSNPIISGTKRMFYHGVDRDTVTNPTVFNLGTGLTRDEHIVRLTRLSNAEAIVGTDFRFNAFFIFDKDRNLPIYTFRTGDSLVSGTVLKLDVSNDSEDMRNDVLVVGRRLGVEVPGGFEKKPLNPNNPTNKFIVSRGIDVSSIFDSNAINFIGRPSQTILIEPSIGSQDRADFWAVQFLNRFRFPGNQAKFESLGHPLMEIGDCIFVDDENKNSIDTSNKLWIEDINTVWGQGKSFDIFETTTFPPWESFIPKTPVSISDFGNVPITDIQITNGGTAVSPYDPYDADASGIFIEIAFDMVISGFLRVSIFSHNGILIAHLLNPNGDEGRRGWIRETFGKNKKVIWDGVDLEGVWNEEKLSVTDAKNWFVAEDSLLGHGKFYVEFEVTDFSGVSRRVKTIDTNTFIFTNRGEQIDANFTLTPVLDTTKDPNFTNTTFKNTSNINRGLQLDILDVTASGFRPSQLRIQIIPWVWGYYREIDSSGGFIDQRIHSPNIPYGGEFLSEVNITNDAFIKYDSNLSSTFFQPKDSGFAFDDWEGLFKQTKPLKKTGSNVQLFYIGWYFGFIIQLTDKSGRTETLRRIQLWTGTGGVAQQFDDLFHGEFFTDSRRRIGGDPNLQIGSGTDKLWSILVERNA